MNIYPANYIIKCLCVTRDEVIPERSFVLTIKKYCFFDKILRRKISARFYIHLHYTDLYLRFN